MENNKYHHEYQQFSVAKERNSSSTDEGNEWIQNHLKKFTDNCEYTEKIRLNYLFDPKRFNFNEVFKGIVSKEEIKFLKQLTKEVIEFTKHVSLELWIEIVIISIENESIDVYNELQKFKNIYDEQIKNVVKSSIIMKYESLVADITNLHADITDGKINEINIFIKKYPNLKVCNDSKNVCALVKSINARKFDVHALLYENDFKTATYKSYEYTKVVEKLDDKEKEKLFDEIKKRNKIKDIIKEIIIRRQFEILEIFTKNIEKLGLDQDLNLGFWNEMSNLSAEEEYFEIYRELIKIKNILVGTDDEPSLYQTLISKFHDDISDGKIEEVEDFIKKYPKLKYCYHESDGENYCALQKAIKSKNFKVYAYLRANGFEADDSHKLKRKIKATRKDFWLHQMISGLSHKEKEKIRQEQLNYAHNKQDHYVDLVLENCRLNGSFNEKLFSKVRELLKALYEIDSFKPIIEILAISNVKIVFDLRNETVEDVDPTRSPDVYGVAYAEEKIFYVAKNVNDDNLLGTLIHEATHMVLYLIYENNYLPYRASDKKKEREWEKVYKKTREICFYNSRKHSRHDIVRRVFNYENEGTKKEIKERKVKEKFELIVRVNHLIATYCKNNDETLREYEELYSELFKFYKEFVLPDLSKDNYNIIQLNNELKLFKCIVESKIQSRYTQKDCLPPFNVSQSCKNYLMLSNIPLVTLSKIFKKIQKQSSNKLNLKAKNIFVRFEALNQKDVKGNIDQILRKSNNLRIIIYLENDEHFDVNNLNFLESFQNSIEIILILNSLNEGLTSEGNKDEKCYQFPLNFTKVDLIHSWNDLSQRSQAKILKNKIKFREESFTLSFLFSKNSQVAPSTLNFLSSEKVKPIELTKPKDQGRPLSRRFQIKDQHAGIDMNAFIEYIRRQKTSFTRKVHYEWAWWPEFSGFECEESYLLSNIVAISDVAGSGKTTMLHDIHKTLCVNYKNFWVCFVSLLKYKNLLKDSDIVIENFFEIIAGKVLKLNELERKFFELKYNRNEVVILFDGFDEISPDCKQNSLKLFDLHKQSEKSQILITTRTHLEEDLEKGLDVQVYKLEPLSEEEQILFLTEYWKNKKSHYDDKNYIKKCARMLVNKISEIVQKSGNLISIILHIENLGKFFKDKLSGEFNKTIREINFHLVYESLVKSSINFKSGNESFNFFLILSDYYEALALRDHFKNIFPHLFGESWILEKLEDSERLEELIRFGIIRYDGASNVFFNHFTYSEFFISCFIRNRVKNFHINKQTKHLKEFFAFFIEILSNQEYEMVKMFLEDSLKEMLKMLEVENSANAKRISKNVKSFVKNFASFITENNIFDWIVAVDDVDILDSLNFVLRFIKEVFADIFGEIKKAYKEKFLLKKISTLHEKISFGEIEEVKEFNRNYPNLKLCYGTDNICALEKAIETKQFKVYVYLRANGFEADDCHRLKREIKCVRKDHRLYSMMRDLSFEEKEEIRQEKLNYAHKNPDHYVDLVLENCELEGPSDASSFSKVKELLEALYKIDNFKPIIEILATSDVKIVFDLRNETVEDVDPTRSPDVYGVAYPEEKRISLKINLSLDQLKGTFIRISTHMVLHLIYENGFLPYKVEDIEKEKEYEEVIEHTRLASINNFIQNGDIIREIFLQDGTEKKELVAAVNLVYAVYFMNPENIRNYEEIYSELFTFYTVKVLSDLRKDFYEVIKVNNDLGLFEDINSSFFEINRKSSFLKSILKLQGLNVFLIYSDDPRETLVKLLQEIVLTSNNRLHAKTQNIFVNFDKLRSSELQNKLIKCSRNQNILKIVIGVPSETLTSDDCWLRRNCQEIFRFLEKLEPSIKVLLVLPSSYEKVIQNLYTIENSKLEIEDKTRFRHDFIEANIEHSWNDLTEESQNDLKIKFRNESLDISMIFSQYTPPSAETLQFLSDEFARIIPSKPYQKYSHMISRKVILKNKELISTPKSLKEFIDETKNKSFVLISDILGSGKTFLLLNIHKILNKIFPNLWVCYVSLREHKNLAIDYFYSFENFLEVLTRKILKLNELERKIFELKYKRNEVVILFDDFDEISPDCRKNLLEFFKLYKEFNKNQIWVTTRTHLEHDIESALDVKSHAIKSLTEEEQIEYLSEFWQETCDDKNLRELCAKLLVKEMTKMSEAFQNLIGIFLQLRLLGERFKNELSENFEEKIKNLNIFEFYEYLVKDSVSFKEKDSVFNIFELRTNLYKALSLKQFYNDDDGHHLFGFKHYIKDLEESEKFEELPRDGIISFYANNKIYFKNAFGDYFLSNFIKSRIKHFKINWQFADDFCMLIKKVLSDVSFDIVRKFLDNFFEEIVTNFENDEGSKNFAECYHGFMVEKQAHDWINPSIVFGVSHFLLFIFKCIKLANFEAFKKIIENKYQTDISVEPFLSNCLVHISDAKIIDSFLDEVFSSYSDNKELLNILKQEDYFGRTVFHNTLLKGKNPLESFSKLWLKIKEQNFKNDEIKEIFSLKDNEGLNFLTIIKALDTDLNTSEYFDEVIDIITRCLSIDEQKEILYDKLKFFELVKFKHSKSLERVLSFFTTAILTSNQIFMMKDENDDTIWHWAAKFSTPEVLKLIFSSFGTEAIHQAGSIRKFITKMNKNGHDMLKSSILSKNFKNFHFIIKQVLSLGLSMKEFVFETDYNFRNVLHYLAQYGNPLDINYFFNRLVIELPMEEIRNFLSQFDVHKNLSLHIAALNENNFKVVLDFFESIFSKENLVKLLNSKNQDGKNVLELLRDDKMASYIKKILDK